MNKYDLTYRVVVTLPDGTIKAVEMQYVQAMICASFASELGLNVEVEAIDK